MSALEDLHPSARCTELRAAALGGDPRTLTRLFAQSTLYAPRTDDALAWREIARAGQRWIRVYDTHAGMQRGEAGGPEDDVEHTQTSGRALRAALPDDVGILLITGDDEETIVAYPAAPPSHRGS